MESPIQMYTLRQTASILGYGMTKIRAMRKSGELRATKFGGRDWRVYGDSIAELQNKKPEAATKPPRDWKAVGETLKEARAKKRAKKPKKPNNNGNGGTSE